MIGRTSRASRFNIDKFSEVLGLRCMEKVVGKRDDFAMDAFGVFHRLFINFFSESDSEVSPRNFALNHSCVFMYFMASLSYYCFRKGDLWYHPPENCLESFICFHLNYPLFPSFVLERRTHPARIFFAVLVCSNIVLF